MFFAELCPSVVPSAHSSQLPLGSLPNEVWNSLKSYKSNGCYKLFPVPLCFILLVHQYMNATKLKAKYFALLGNVLSAFNKSQKPRSVQGRATQTTKAWWKKKKRTEGGLKGTLVGFQIHLHMNHWKEKVHLYSVINEKRSTKEKYTGI